MPLTLPPANCSKASTLNCPKCEKPFPKRSLNLHLSIYVPLVLPLSCLWHLIIFPFLQPSLLTHYRQRSHLSPHSAEQNEPRLLASSQKSRSLILLAVFSVPVPGLINFSWIEVIRPEHSTPDTAHPHLIQQQSKHRGCTISDLLHALENCSGLPLQILPNYKTHLINEIFITSP